MKLVEITDQMRRDFTGTYVCESCGNKEERHGYDDDNFHVNVTPNWKCKKCGKSTKDIGVEVVPVATKYDANEVV